MKHSSIFIGIAALPILAACGGGSGGDQGFTGYPAQNTDGGTFEQQLSTTGISGYIGKSDGTISEIMVRLDASGEEPIYYVGIDGGEEVPFSVNFVSGSVTNIVDADGNFINFLRSASGDSAGVPGSDAAKENYIDGFVGLQTAELPEDTLFYGGNLSVYSSGSGDFLIINSEDLLLTVNFGTGDVTGNATGALSFSPLIGDSTEGSVDLDISGSMDGAVLTGLMEVTGDATGELDMAGAVYGETAFRLLGAAAGAVTYDGAEINLGGYFQTADVTDR